MQQHIMSKNFSHIVFYIWFRFSNHSTYQSSRCSPSHWKIFQPLLGERHMYPILVFNTKWISQNKTQHPERNCITLPWSGLLSRLTRKLNREHQVHRSWRKTCLKQLLLAHVFAINMRSHVFLNLFSLSLGIHYLHAF
jgi:hypothetical protein